MCIFVDLLLFDYLLLLALHCLLSALHRCNSCMASFFICVDIMSEAVYELAIEPIQEPQAGESQTEAAVEPGPEVANSADLQGKPRSISPILITPCYI